MAHDPEQIRLPELPVFKRYSLALRQEYASVEEISAVLQRTSAKLEELVERAERKAREALERVEEVEEEEAVEQADVGTVEIEESELFDEPLDDERPFWEAPEPLPEQAPSKAPKKPRATKKRKPAKRHSVVAVGQHGRPLGKASQPSLASAKKAAPPRTTSKPKPKTKPKPKAKVAVPKSKAKAKPAPRQARRGAPKKIQKKATKGTARGSRRR